MSQFKEINTENKLRLRLTVLALNTLREDAVDFGLGLTTLLNRMLAVFSPEAQASLSVRLAQYRQRLTDVLGSGETATLERLVSAEAARLQAKVPAYADRPEAIVFRISNDNLFLLTKDPTTQEEHYYPRGIKAYVEALTEEFSRLPFIAREKVYCSAVYQALTAAMQAEQAVYLLHSFGQKYLVRVYGITTDPFATYHYVIARLIDPKRGRQHDRIYSFRLSRIARVIPKPGISGAFTDEERQKTARAVAKNGAPFLCDRINKIVVRFTDAGLRQFATQLYLRPHASKIRDDGHTYEFACTYAQALFYFQRLGAGAHVLKPAAMRRELAKWFAAAAEIYQEKK